MYLKENREVFTKEAGKKVTEVTKLAAERWKALSSEAKAPYEKQYADVQEQYKKDLDAFLTAGGEKQQRGAKRKGRGGGDGEAAGRGRGRGRAKADPAAPKKLVGGAYGCFIEKHREAFTKELGKGGPAVAKLASERWKALSDAEKKEYEDRYQEKKKEYEEAKKAYDAGGAAGAAASATTSTHVEEAAEAEEGEGDEGQDDNEADEDGK